MLSYVIPAQETSAANGSASTVTAQRNLSLNLSATQYDAPQQSTLKPSSAQEAAVDAMLANVPNDTCDERTRLLSGSVSPLPPPPPTQRPRRQNSNNNNNSLTMNNNCGGVGDGGGDGNNSVVGVELGEKEDDTLSEDRAETTTTVTADSDASDKQQFPPRQTTKKPKLTKLGSKSVGLKRVSFGSSKGSMVETLVFETPTPLSEHVEPTFGFEIDSSTTRPTNNYNIYSKENMDDSGIEVQEEAERSIVRVSIYQSNQPQQICPPEYLSRFEDTLDNSFSNYTYNLEDIMTTTSTIAGYDRQQSTDSGWDNPFRPGGDLSREADEIVNMIRGGKPITPTDDHSVGNGKAQREDNCNGTTASEAVTKTNITQNQSAQNGTNSHRVPSTATTATAKSPENNGVTSLAQVSKQVVPGPTSASHVVIDEKKNKKKGCCVVQ